MQPLRKANSSAPSTRGARSAAVGAVNSLSSRVRPATSRRRRHNRAA
ncbi:hypothetical protein [Streptomyces sp. YKOK-I1]